MALFKPVYGSVILPKKTVDGYAYVHTETGEFFADVSGGKRVQISGQYAQALRTVAEDATNNKYITTLVNAGDTNKPVYFKDGIPVECKTLALNTTGQAGSVAHSLTVKDNGTARYSFNGAAARVLNFKSGNEITVATDASGNVTVNHNTKATAATIGEGGTSRTLGWGGTFNIPSVTYNAYGHVTGSGFITLTMPGNPNTHYSAKLYLGVADGTANATTVISDPYLFVRENGSNTAVQLKGGTGINISGINGAATISLANTTVTAGTYGPSTDVSGANGNVIKVPQITVDAQGRITSVIEKEYTSVDTNTDTNTAHAHSNPANSGLKLTGTGGTSGTVQYSVNTDFTTSASARKYKVEVDSTSGGLYVNVPWTDTNTDTNTTYTAGAGLVLSSTTFSLDTSGAVAGEYGPTADVTGNNGAAIKIPKITVDKYGRVTSIAHYTYTSVNTDTNTDTNTAHAHSAGTGLTISGSGGISGTTTYSANLKSTTSLGTIGTTDRLYAVGVDKDGKLCVNVPWVDTNTDTNTTYTAGAGLTLTSTVFSLSTSGVTAGEYGPTTNVSGSNGAKIKVPQISVDQYGRVTKVVEREYTSVDTNTDSNTAHGHSAGGAGLTCNNVGGISGTSTYTLNLNSTTSLGTLGTTGKLYAVGVDANGKLCVSVPWTDTNTDTNTTYSAGTGLTLNSTIFSLATSGVTEGKYGPSADVNGSNGAKINVPEITVDAYGRVTKVTNRVYTSVNIDTNTNTAHSHTAGTGLTISGSGGTSGTTTYSANLNSTTSLGTIGKTSRLYAVGVDANGKLCVNVPWTDTNTDTNTTYSAGTGLSLSGTTFNLTNTTVTAGTYGPSANVSGSNGAKINVPQITVDAQGRITSVVNRTYTSVNTDTDTDTKVTQGKSTSSGWRAVLLHNTYTANYGTDPSQTTATVYYNEAIAVQCNTGALKATAVYGAVWNDYAEYRATKEEVEAGRVVIENGDDTLSLATERLMPGANIVSDTFGFAIGETEDSKTPLAVSGRALAYPYEDRDSYKPGDPVCSGPNGTVSKMTREEVMMYPDRILGTVSAIPEYETWGTGNVAVNGRIWIKVK